MAKPAPDCIFIAMTTAAGGLEVMQFIAPADVPDEAIDREISRRPPGSAEIVSWRRIEEADYRAMGKDRDFRAAWRDDGKALQVSLDMARDCTRDRLRGERRPMMEALDIEAARALETGDVTSLDEIATEKRRLRDITQHPSIDAAKSLDDLRAVSIEAGK